MKIAVFITRRDNEVVKNILTGIHRRAKENNVDVFVFMCNAGMNLHNANTIGEHQIFGLPLLTDYDGVIIVAQQIALPRVNEELLAYVEKTKVPAICIEEETEKIQAVGSNIYKGMYALVEHVIKEHHPQTLCYIAGYDCFESNQQNCAVRDAVAANGIKLQDSMVFHRKNGYHDGLLAARKLYDTFGKDLLPDAIICNNDDIAMGVIDYFEYYTEDVRVPRDVIVTGFYRTMAGKYHFCMPTTVSCNNKEVGYVACDTLLSKIAGMEVQSTFHDVKLILGCSCGCKEQDKNDMFEHYKMTYRVYKENEYFTQSIHEMSDFIVSAKTQEEVFEYLKNYIPLTEVEAFYVMLEDSSAHVDRQRKVNFHSAFDYIIDVPLIWKNNEFSSFEELETRKLLPNYKHANGDLYIVYPINFQEQAKGYCILKNPWHMLISDYIVSFMQTINNSLELFNQKNRLIKMNEQLNQLYIKDSLTGLLNRFGYEKKAGSQFMHNNKENIVSMVAFIDLDRLKYINDNFGHEYGDMSILVITGMIKRVFPKKFVKVRFGGDEFIVFGECADEATAEEYAKKLDEELERSKEISIFPFEIYASFGYVLTKPGENRTLSEYVLEADQNMYVKKLEHKALRNQLQEKDDRL